MLAYRQVITTDHIPRKGRGREVLHQPVAYGEQFFILVSLHTACSMKQECVCVVGVVLQNLRSDAVAGIHVLLEEVVFCAHTPHIDVGRELGQEGGAHQLGRQRLSRCTTMPQFVHVEEPERGGEEVGGGGERWRKMERGGEKCVYDAVMDHAIP